MYSKENDQESLARVLSRASIVSWYLLSHCDDIKEIEYFRQKHQDVSDKAWEISKEIGNIYSLADALLAKGGVGFIESFIYPFRWKTSWKEHFKNICMMCDESISLAKDYDDSRILGIIYGTAGRSYGFFGLHFIDDEREQRSLIDKGLKMCEEGLIHAKKSKDKQVIIWSLFWLDWWALLGGRFKFIQNRIFDDLLEMVELGSIYKDSYTIWYFYSNFLPTICYTNFAQRSFFTPTQRKSYAKTGIRFGLEALKSSSNSPFSAWPYQMLTWLYSQLVIFSITKEERENYAQNMLKYGKQAELISEKFEGGLSRAAGYSSLYRAYKTFADIAENKEERVKMLIATIDAQKKYIEHAMEGRTGLLAAQMRLGFLYEQLGISTGNIDPLLMAKETFLAVIKDSLEKGYYSYAAATHEYIAHIEDRMGNHTAAAEHYKKVQETYIDSLKSIKYKLLKDRIKEKINYAHAWDLIEMAKSYHKREEHLDAKKNYIEACETLKELPNYIYEAYYYSAWIYQEEGEQLSKQEKHEEAITNYEETQKIFKKAIKMIEKFYEQSTDKNEKERIKRLNKLAMIRIDHCSARIDIEEARILGKKGNHQIAAEKFVSAALKFKEVCSQFQIEREREELEAVYYLCRAWESMELGECYEDPVRFEEAANLFKKASEMFIKNKMKLLASGNSAFCEALEYGCKFDETSESHLKAELYPKIKVMLRKAANSYRKGGFENEANWALATSAYFDAAWYLIRADQEMKIDEKESFLKIGSEILKSALKLFSKAGYKSKAEEILKLIEMIDREEEILVLALDTIREPSISRSTIGFGAPTCPIETSQSPRISEARRWTSEINNVEKEGAEKDKREKVKVFISYASVDSSFFDISKISKKLIKYPEIEQVLFWEEDLHDDIYDYMDKNLGQCDIFLLFCSPNANKSDAVKMEWQTALKIRKKVIPVFINEKDIPTLLSTKLGVQFINDDINRTTEQIYQLILKKLEIFH